MTKWKRAFGVDAASAYDELKELATKILKRKPTTTTFTRWCQDSEIFLPPEILPLCPSAGGVDAPAVLRAAVILVREYTREASGDFLAPSAEELREMLRAELTEYRNDYLPGGLCHASSHRDSEGATVDEIDAECALEVLSANQVLAHLDTFDFPVFECGRAREVEAANQILAALQDADAAIGRACDTGDMIQADKYWGFPDE
jgi:hypothetical protein